jgi:hypothetical protein
MGKAVPSSLEHTRSTLLAACSPAGSLKSRALRTLAQVVSYLSGAAVARSFHTRWVRAHRSPAPRGARSQS